MLEPTDAGHAMGDAYRVELRAARPCVEHPPRHRARSIVAEAASAILLLVVLAFFVITWRYRKRW